MQNIDNHMDELFQKAAENYPLKTAPGNFDDLVPFIAGKTFTHAEPGRAKRKRKTAVLFFACLIIGISVSTYLIKNNSNIKTSANNAAVQETGTIFQSSKTALAKNTDVAIPGKNATKNGFTAPANIFEKNKPGILTNGNAFINITPVVPVTEDPAETENDQPDNKTIFTDKAYTVTAEQQHANKDKINPEVKIEITGKPVQKKETVIDESKPTVNNDKKNKSKPALYYGLAVGAEFNQVKSQEMTKAGFNAGMILGLQVSKKISVETGLQFSQKKYYSQGRYFKPKTDAMPLNMTVNSLAGTSTLIEIPVAVKYNFSKKKNTLYAKAGVSSYIMTKESNKYQAVVGGQQIEINSTYKNPHVYWASDVRISAGYQHTLSKKLTIRIEPFFQIPLKGIGIGALPVTSTGLQFILTRN